MSEHAQGRAQGGDGGCRAGTGLVVVSRQDPSWERKSQLLPWEAVAGGQSRASPQVTTSALCWRARLPAVAPALTLCLRETSAHRPVAGSACALLGPSGPFPMEASAGP